MSMITANTYSEKPVYFVVGVSGIRDIKLVVVGNQPSMIARSPKLRKLSTIE